MAEQKSVEFVCADEKLEKEIYRSCLKQVVEYLNTTLPPLEDSDESSNIEKPKVEKKKDKFKKKEEDTDYYLLRDTQPTRTIEKCTKKKPQAFYGKKKRVNEFSERKVNDIKINKKARKSGPKK